MAITEVSYTVFNDGESGSSVRTKLNTLGSRVVTLSQQLISENTSIDDRLDDLELDVGVLKNKKIINLGTSTQLAVQTLVPNVATKLIYATTVIFNPDNGFTYSIPNQEVTVPNTGIYHLSGMVSLTADASGDNVSITMYKNGSATPNIVTLQGVNNVPITFVYNAYYPLTANDVITLYVKSTNNSIQIEGSSFTIEKTNY